MSVPTDNNMTVKDCNKTIQYKDAEIETEKLWHSLMTTLLVIMKAYRIHIFLVLK